MNSNSETTYDDARKLAELIMEHKLGSPGITFRFGTRLDRHDMEQTVLIVKSNVREQLIEFRSQITDLPQTHAIKAALKEEPMRITSLPSNAGGFKFLTLHPAPEIALR